MGKDKGTLFFHGQTLLQRVLNSLPPLDEIILVLRDEKQEQAYQQILRDFKGELRVVLDRERDQGPLLGILSGLEALKSDHALIIPCDSPCISPHFVEEMLEHPLEDYQALVPRWSDGRTEPLHAVYSKEDVLPVIEKIIQQGRRDVQSIFNQLKVLYLDAESLDPGGNTFLNLNRLQDVEVLEKKKLK